MTALLESLGITNRAGVETFIERLIELLDDIDPDIEAEPGTWVEHAIFREHETVADADLEEEHDREFDQAEDGIADQDGLMEQLPGWSGAAL